MNVDADFTARDDFEGASDVRIGFKSTEQENPNEHWMNRASIWCTRKWTDRWPGGSISHAEIMLQVCEGEWRRWSIAKKTRVRGEDGKLVWRPGRVHNRPVDHMNDEYVYVTLSVPRRRQRRMYEFLESQVGGTFNFYGYMFNFVCPCCFIGTNYYERYIETYEGAWFCTELITTALQTAMIEPFVRMRSCKTSPNALYRECVRVEGAMASSNPSSRYMKLEIE